MGKKRRVILPHLASKLNRRGGTSLADSVGSSQLGVTEASALANKKTSGAGGVAADIGGEASKGAGNLAPADAAKKKKKGTLGANKDTILQALAADNKIVKSSGKYLGA
jgi:hypothetical protein